MGERPARAKRVLLFLEQRSQLKQRLSVSQVEIREIPGGIARSSLGKHADRLPIFLVRFGALALGLQRAATEGVRLGQLNGEGERRARQILEQSRGLAVILQRELVVFPALQEHRQIVVDLRQLEGIVPVARLARGDRSLN